MIINSSQLYYNVGAISILTAFGCVCMKDNPKTALTNSIICFSVAHMGVMSLLFAFEEYFEFRVKTLNQ